MKLQAEFPEKLGFLFEPHRYKVAYGGRAGTKSWAYARALLILAAQRKLRILCCREIQKSIADSVHKLLSDQIVELGLAGLYSVTHNTIKCVNGSEFVFAGLHANLESIKSMEAIDIAWIEEAQSVSDKSIEMLVPTVRKDGSELWFSFNPYLDSDPVYQRFVVNPPEGAMVVQIGWQDNPWLSDVMRAEKDYLYSVDADAADHVWGGATIKNSEAQVLRGRWRVESFEPDESWDGPYFGIDFGYATTPTVMVKSWIHTKSLEPPDMDLYIEHSVGGFGIDITDTPAKFDEIPGAREHVARADNSRPETISYMRQHGYRRVTPCEKGQGSVEDGVEFLRSFKAIIIHTRCQLAAEQAKLYSFKVDKLTGDIQPVLAKRHDDVWDAVRYSLEPVIKRFARGKPEQPKPLPPDRWRDIAAKQRRGLRGESWKVV